MVGDIILRGWLAKLWNSCRLCDESGGDVEWLCNHLESLGHQEKLVEELMRSRGWPLRFLRAAPEELQRQIELARQRVDAHLRILDWVIEGNSLDEY